VFGDLKVNIVDIYLDLGLTARGGFIPTASTNAAQLNAFRIHTACFTVFLHCFGSILETEMTFSKQLIQTSKPLSTCSQQI